MAAKPVMTSLDNIKLNPNLLQQLYRNTLVETEKAGISTPIFKKPSFTFLGKNEKNISIIVSEKDNAFLAEADLDLLVGILTACHLSLADVAIVNCYGNKDLNYQELIVQFSPAIIMLFGVEPENLEFPLHFPNYKLQQHSLITYLSAASLNTLSSDNEQKKKLWGCLQQYFLGK